MASTKHDFVFIDVHTWPSGKKKRLY